MILNTLDKFLLIAHHPQKGRFLISDIYINYGIIGAVLLEMALNKQINIENDKLILEINADSKHSVIAAIIKEIRASKKDRKVKYWITKLARNSSKYKWSILLNLERNNLLRVVNKKFLGLIPYKKSYLTELIKRKYLISQLRLDALSGNDLDNDAIIMLGLIEACKMHKIIISDKLELKRLKKELKKIIENSPVAETLDKTIKQVQASIMIAIIASTAAVSAASYN